MFYFNVLMHLLKCTNIQISSVLVTRFSCGELILKRKVVCFDVFIRCLELNSVYVFIKKTEDEILSFNQQITNLDIDVNVMKEVNKLFRNNTSEEFTKIKDVVSENLGENLY